MIRFQNFQFQLAEAKSMQRLEDSITFESLQFKYKRKQARNLIKNQKVQDRKRKLQRKSSNSVQEFKRKVPSLEKK